MSAIEFLNFKIGSIDDHEILHGDIEVFESLNKTKKIEYIRNLIKHIPNDSVFECDLIANLISREHYFLRDTNIKPVFFKKASPKIGHSGYDFKGYFNEIKGWHPVSWRKSIEGESSFYSIFTEQARLSIAPLMRDHKLNNPVCEVCKSEQSEEVDHVDPEFKDIVENALELVSERDISLFKSCFDFFSTKKTWIPEYHPAIRYVIDRHRTAHIKAVCHSCHLQSSKLRKVSA